MDQTPEELAQKIKEARAREQAEHPSPKGSEAPGSSGTGRALGAAADLVAGVLVGAFIGYWIDRWLGTNPWGMIILLFLGFGAGLVNIQRAEAGQDFKTGYRDDKKETDE